ncbi:MAG TPA: hypothetical protein VF099_08370, partial [Ktedonobacterales bacterium]
MQYLDFDLEITPRSGNDYEVVARATSGQAVYTTMRFPYDEQARKDLLKDLRIALLRTREVARKVLSGEERAVQQFGKTLFEALLADDVRSLYDVSREAARRQGQGLRLRLHIRAAELAALPWEYLYDPRVPDYLCFSSETP